MFYAGSLPSVREDWGRSSDLLWAQRQTIKMGRYPMATRPVPRHGLRRNTIATALLIAMCGADAAHANSFELFGLDAETQFSATYSAAWRLNSPDPARRSRRSEEHTSELQSLMRISYAVFCLKKKKKKRKHKSELYMRQHKSRMKTADN